MFAHNITIFLFSLILSFLYSSVTIDVRLLMNLIFKIGDEAFNDAVCVDFITYMRALSICSNSASNEKYVFVKVSYIKYP